MTEISVISVQGREYLTGQTIAALSSRGGIGDMRATLYWSGRGEPPNFPGWRIIGTIIERPASLSVLRIFEDVQPGNDLLFLEDDVIPCRNAIIMAANVPFPANCGLISFFDYRCEWKSPGIFKAPVKKRYLCGSQAIKFPWPVLQQLIPLLREKIGYDRVAGKLSPADACWDTWMGKAVEDLGMDIYHYSPTLFQHGGAKWSIANEGAKHPYAQNFPGEEWDALTECPDPVPKGTWTEYFKKCRFHGITHKNGVVCRYWPITHREKENQT